MSRIYAVMFAVFGLYLAGIGGYLTASVLLSPRLEVTGQVKDLSTSRARAHTSYYVTLLVRSKKIGHLDTTKAVHQAVRAGDTVRVIYRQWDDTATRVEVLEGNKRGWIWKKGIGSYLFFGELFWGSLLFLVGLLIVWGAIAALRKPTAVAPAASS